MLEEDQENLLNIDQSWLEQKPEKNLAEILPIPKTPSTASLTPATTPPPPRNIFKEILRAGLIFVFSFIFIYLFLTFPAYWSKGKYYWNELFDKTAKTLNIPADINQTSSDIFLDTIKDALEKSPERKLTQKYSIDISDLENNFLIIPKISVKSPIIWNVAPDEDLMLKNLQNGVIHYNGTGLPDQPSSNVFISGHSSYYWWDKGRYKTVFVNLDQLASGDEIALAYQDKVYIYKVYEKIVVKPQQTEVLLPTDKPILSLMTCVPVGTNLKRLVVKAERLQITSSKEEQEQQELQKLEEIKKKTQEPAPEERPPKPSLDTTKPSEQPIPRIEKNPLELLPWVD